MTDDLKVVEAALDDIRNGRIVIVVDDETRENEGDLVMAAEKVTPEAINFIAREGRGLICVPMTGERLDELDLHPMVGKNTSIMGTAFAVSVDAARGTTTGISAHDRATTIRALVDPATRPSDLARPGHIFPLRASDGGVLKRAGHTEATVDLCRMAGLAPAGVLCEIMGEDGSMARMPELERMAERFGLRIVSVRSLIEYRQRTEKLVGELRKIFGEKGIPAVLNAETAMFSIFFTEKERVENLEDVQSSDGKLYSRLFHALLEEGVMLAPSPYEAIFLSTAHDERVLDETITAFERAASKIG